ncbi:unnamed protein product [Blepharisma stoltei]|uniref:Uncharacterized protein n=1 Tax=Blepharisma stoltei TaxID=1481888 RepID=A0AAU9IU60_9CILI|nr:unnamed protein product [Blepharisma stoltei]
MKIKIQAYPAGLSSDSKIFTKTEFKPDQISEMRWISCLKASYFLSSLHKNSPEMLTFAHHRENRLFIQPFNILKFKFNLCQNALEFFVTIDDKNTIKTLVKIFKNLFFCSMISIEIQEK